METKDKSSRKLNNQAKGFINNLSETLHLDKNVKNMLLDTFGIKRGLKSFFHVFSKNEFPTNRKDIIKTICGTLKKLTVNRDIDEFEPLKKIHLRDNKPHSYYLNLAHTDFGKKLPSNEELMVVAYRLYDKYGEYLEAMRANKTDLIHTLKYNTGVQTALHRMPKINEFLHTKGSYFYDTNEKFVKLERNKEEGDKKLSINKYFSPIYIRLKQATENTVRDTEKLNQQNKYEKGLKEISLKVGDYIVDVDISPHQYEGGKPLKEAYKKLQTYLSGPVYDDIIADGKRNGKEIKKEDIHISFLYGITALTTFAKAGGREVRHMPLKDIKRTSTYMYGLVNPHGKWTEQPLMLRIKGIFSKKARMQYKQLKRMANKFDARDIGFTSTPLETFLKKDMD